MNKSQKHREVLNRDDYWMGIAFMLSAGSNLIQQQACIILGEEQEVVGMSHNGRSVASNPNHICHAEINALLNSKRVMSGTAYITHTPCYNCIICLLAANIKRIIYYSTSVIDENTLDAVQCGFAQIIEYKGNLNWMRDHFRTLNIF